MRTCTPPTRRTRARLNVPEKRHARHILVTGKDDATALALAQQVWPQAKGGKDFGELAKQYSQDPGSAHNGGDLGWSERGAFVAPFADALFSMKVGEIRGPVKTQFGYHIIRLDEVQAGKGKTFEEARADLEAQLRRDRATDRFGEIQEQLQSKLAEPGADLDHARAGVPPGAGRHRQLPERSRRRPPRSRAAAAGVGVCRPAACQRARRWPGAARG